MRNAPELWLDRVDSPLGPLLLVTDARGVVHALDFADYEPRMRRLMPQGHSLTEYAWFRFGKAMYVFTLGVMVFYMFIFLSAELTGTALALRLVADIPLGVTAAAVGGTIGLGLAEAGEPTTGDN